jgi:SPP1 family holin
MNTIKPGTIIRTIVLALALLNQILSASGHAVLPIADETIEQAVTAIFTIVTAVIAWWKNNSFTQEAMEADELMHQLKADNKKY